MKRSEFLNDLRGKCRSIRNEVQTNFYFLEVEDLRRRPAKGKWNIIETLAHINLTQGIYIENISKGLQKADEVNHDEVQLSWLGRQLVHAMEPRDGHIPYKMPTFPKINPAKRAKKGIAIDEKVVFSQLITDIEELEDLMIKTYDYDIDQVKIPSIFPWLKISIADALAFNLAHTERHLLQAKKIVEVDEDS
ncbi:MAG: DinB family protein [Owenweeksia sp.]|nr:DinB family protein [Owenweeksia sp.]